MTDIYAATDRAVSEMNRWCLQAFGRLKLAPKDELHIVQAVRTVYREATTRFAKKLRKAAEEDFLLFLMMCGWSFERAEARAQKLATQEWVTERMREVDTTTRYRFEDETERKEMRLIESMTVPEGRDAEIDRALKLWSRQMGQFSIWVADMVMQQACEGAGIELVRWNTRKDEKVCPDCDELDGKVFRLDRVPRKPHWGCRCYLTPVRG